MTTEAIDLAVSWYFMIRISENENLVRKNKKTISFAYVVAGRKLGG